MVFIFIFISFHIYKTLLMTTLRKCNGQVDGIMRDCEVENESMIDIQVESDSVCMSQRERECKE